MLRFKHAAIITLVIGSFLATAGGAAEKIKTLAVGSKAPDFRLPGVDTKMHRLGDYDEAKVLVIVFTCNHCPTAQAYEERIKKLTSDYKDKGVALVAISPNDPKAVRLDELGYTDVGDTLADMKFRAKDKNFNFPYLYDGDDQKVAKAYGPVTTPHVFIFDGDRRLRYVGRIDDNERKPGEATSHDARNAIDAILAGKPVPVETTKTSGCSIKWSEKRRSVAQAFEKWAREPVAVSAVDLPAVRKLLKNDSGNLRLVNIWASWCGPCVAEFPDLVEVHRMYRRRNFEMIGINVEGPGGESTVRSFLKKYEASFPNYIFSGDAHAFIEAVDPKWPGAIPYTLVIAPGGEVIYNHLGTVDPLTLKHTLVEELGRTYK